MVGGLFDEPGSFDRDGLAGGLHALAAQNIFIGGSSWKYEGWLGQIYTRERYLTRGRFSQKIFEQECLREYAETFPTVCGDFAFYQFPTEEFWKRLFARVPEGFRFAFKVPEQITCKLFPQHARYGAQAGKENETFLDAQVLREMFLRPLLPYREKTARADLRIRRIRAAQFRRIGGVSGAPGPVSGALPREFRYAVEIRNPEFLDRDYFACLRRHRVAHVYNAWSKMPELRHQMAIPDSVTADFLVSRALLRRGRMYEDAVGMFAAIHGDSGPESGGARIDARADRARAGEQAVPVSVRE